jgi:competence transcription factor ComK
MVQCNERFESRNDKLFFLRVYTIIFHALEFHSFESEHVNSIFLHWNFKDNQRKNDMKQMFQLFFLLLEKEIWKSYKTDMNEKEGNLTHFQPFETW